MKKKQEKISRQEKNFRAGNGKLKEIPGIAGVWEKVHIQYKTNYPMGRSDWAYVTSNGEIYANPAMDGEPAEWTYVLAHCCLHLALGHIREDRQKDPIWQWACDCIVARFLADSKIGRPPPGLDAPVPANAKEEERFYTWLKTEGASAKIPQFSIMASSAQSDMRWEPEDRWRQMDWPALFAQDVQWAIRQAIRTAAGAEPERRWDWGDSPHAAAQAREWFISSYPLLGAVAARFRLVTDGDLVRRMGIPIAAVSSLLGEIYINPKAKLTESEWRFVLAHEFLHAALRHDVRCDGREPDLWNVACDFVINLWLQEMKVGQMPVGVLYDEKFRGLSAESVYDQLLEDLKYYTGLNSGDLLYDDPNAWACDEAAALDDYFRRAIQRGLEYHQQAGRGLVPAGLIEEVHAINRPPIRWDVELAKWFDEQFQPLENCRTYARLSRRQSSTPDIPRPAWQREDAAVEGRMFGVLLDTSGSMDRHLLAVALGAIASYSQARDVAAVRVVFCDAAVYDQGILRPEEIAGVVKIQGRGGTRLQPGIDLLDQDKCFPQNAPLLVITDGGCDRLNLHGRTHAYLLPKGRRLPFAPKGPVFGLT